MRTNKLFKKLVGGQFTDGLMLTAEECANLSQWVFDLHLENQELIQKYAEEKDLRLADDSGSYDSLIPDDAFVTAYRKDNADLKRKLAVAEPYMSYNTVLLARALKAEALIKSLIAVGNIILNQDGKLDEDIKLAEAVWRVLVGQANE